MGGRATGQCTRFQQFIPGFSLCYCWNFGLNPLSGFSMSMGTDSVCQFHHISSPTVPLRAFSFLMLAWGTLVSLWSAQIVASLLRTRRYAWMRIFHFRLYPFTNIITYY